MIFPIAFALCGQEQLMTTATIAPNYIETITDDELERLWSACHAITDGNRLVRKETLRDIVCLAADLSIERTRRINAKIAARAARAGGEA